MPGQPDPSGLSTPELVERIRRMAAINPETTESRILRVAADRLWFLQDIASKPLQAIWEKAEEEARRAWFGERATQRQREPVTFPAASGSWGTITDTVIGTTEQ
jgi:hypothetical protein